MASRKRSIPDSTPLGERLRVQRTTALQKGLREMAKVLDVTPAYLTDIELGRRTPAEDLMVRIADAYRVPLAELRSGFSRPEAVVAEVASQSAVNAAKVPEFLRTARDLPAESWDRLIEQAKAEAERQSRRDRQEPST